MNDIVVEPVPVAEKPVFARYFQAYLREHAAFTGKTPVDGVFPYPWFDLYWQEPDQRWAFWMRQVDDVIAIALSGMVCMACALNERVTDSRSVLSSCFSTTKFLRS